MELLRTRTTATDVADDAVLTRRDGSSTGAFAAVNGGTATVVSAIRGTRTAALPAGTPGRGGASDGTTVRHDRITRYALVEADDIDYSAIDLRIGNEVTGKSEVDGSTVTYTTTDATGVYEDLAAVDVDVDALEVTRNASTNVITATWEGPGSPQLEQRIALHVRVDATNNIWEWVVFGRRDRAT